MLKRGGWSRGGETEWGHTLYTNLNTGTDTKTGTLFFHTMFPSVGPLIK